MGLSAIPQGKLEHNLGERLRKVIHLPGDVVECGVYKGGSAQYLSRIVQGTGKFLYLFDTFEGMPETDPTVDHHKKGDFRDTSVGNVRSLFKDMDFVQVYEGLFRDTLLNITDKSFCFVHVDCDIYSSVKECCEFFYPKMIPGGILVFDDYWSPTCKGATKAVDEFAKSSGASLSLDARDDTCVITRL